MCQNERNADPNLRGVGVSEIVGPEVLAMVTAMTRMETGIRRQEASRKQLTRMPW